MCWLSYWATLGFCWVSCWRLAAHTWPPIAWAAHTPKTPLHPYVKPGSRPISFLPAPHSPTNPTALPKRNAVVIVFPAVYRK